MCYGFLSISRKVDLNNFSPTWNSIVGMCHNVLPFSFDGHLGIFPVFAIKTILQQTYLHLKLVYFWKYFIIIIYKVDS